MPGAFAGTGKLLNLHVSGQVSRRTVALVQPREVAATVADLVTTTEGVTGDGVQEQAAVQVVVNLALATGDTVVVTAAVISRGVAVFAVVGAIEVTQVRLQNARADCPVVGQTQEVLLVEVFQVAVVVLGGQVFGELVVTTSVVELVGELACAVVGAAVGTANRQVFVVAGVTTFGLFDLTSNQGQILDVVGSDLATLEGLRQQTTIVGHDNWQLRLQGAQLQLGLGDLDLAGYTQAGEIVDGLVAIAWEYSTARKRTVVVPVFRAAGIQANAVQANSVNTELHRTLGVARDETQVKTLAPLRVFAVAGSRVSAIAVISVDVEVTRTQCGVAVFDETGSACLLSDYAQSYRQCQGGLLHVPLLSFLIFVFLWSRV